MTADQFHVQGCCPMGCGQTLFLADGGYVTCSYLHCPRPDAVSSILEDADSRHVVILNDPGFTVRHPLRERLDGELEHCPLHGYLASLDGPPYQPGRYWVTGQPGNLTWEPAPQPEETHSG